MQGGHQGSQEPLGCPYVGPQGAKIIKIKIGKCMAGHHASIIGPANRLPNNDTDNDHTPAATSPIGPAENGKFLACGLKACFHYIGINLNGRNLRL